MRLDPVEIAAQVAPWCGPLPTAWVVGERAFSALAMPWPVAVSAGIAVELSGLAAMHTALTLRSYNGQRKPGEPGAPTWLAAGCVGIYAVSTAALTVMIGAPLVTLSFVALSLASFVVLTLRADQKRRVAQVAQAREEAAQAAAQRREELRAQRAARAAEKRKAAQVAQVDAQRRATRADWRAISASLDGKRATCAADDVLAALVAQGYAPIPRRTAQVWARETREGQ